MGDVMQSGVRNVDETICLGFLYWCIFVIYGGEWLAHKTYNLLSLNPRIMIQCFSLLPDMSEHNG